MLLRRLSKNSENSRGRTIIYEELAMKNYLMETDIKNSLDERKWLFKNRMDDIDIGKFTFFFIFCCCWTKAIFLPLNKKIPKTKNISKLYDFCGTRNAKQILTSFNTLVERKVQTLCFVTNKKLNILLDVNGFKLHNLVADNLTV